MRGELEWRGEVVASSLSSEALPRHPPSGRSLEVELDCDAC